MGVGVYVAFEILSSLLFDYSLALYHPSHGAILFLVIEVFGCMFNFNPLYSVMGFSSI